MMTSSHQELSPGPQPDPRLRRMELLISNLLRIGVIVSLVLVVVGMVLFFIQNPGSISSSEAAQALVFTDTDSSFKPTRMLAGLANLRGESVIALGLLFLISTPISRVAVSIFLFLFQKDRTFTLITACVLFMLLLSFFIGGAE